LSKVRLYWSVHSYFGTVHCELTVKILQSLRYCHIFGT